MKSKVQNFRQEFEHFISNLQSQFSNKETNVVSLNKLDTETDFFQNTIFINTGLAFAEKGYSVLLVDLDGGYDYKKTVGNSTIASWKSLKKIVSENRIQDFTRTKITNLFLLSAENKKDKFIANDLNVINSLIEIKKEFDLVVVNLPVPERNASNIKRMVQNSDIILLSLLRHQTAKKSVRNWNKIFKDEKDKISFVLLN